MGLFDFFRKSKTDVELFYEEQQEQFEESSEFLLIVEDTFHITHRGTVIVGNIQSGSVSVGDNVTICRKDGTQLTVTVAALEKFRKTLNTAHAGDNVGILFKEITKNDISRGDKLTK